MIKRVFVFLGFGALTILYSCNPLRGHVGMSNSINESKSRGVFVSEYEPESNPIRINDSLVFQVDQAWLEKNWKYSDNNKSIVIDGYQLIIRLVNTVPEGFDQTWTIGVEFKRHIRTCGKRCLITDFDVLPSNNMESWPIQRGWKLTNDLDKEVIGQIRFNKKNPL